MQQSNKTINQHACLWTVEEAAAPGEKPTQAQEEQARKTDPKKCFSFHFDLTVWYFLY